MSITPSEIIRLKVGYQLILNNNGLSHNAGKSEFDYYIGTGN